MITKYYKKKYIIQKWFTKIRELAFKQESSRYLCIYILNLNTHVNNMYELHYSLCMEVCTQWVSAYSIYDLMGLYTVYATRLV